MYKKNTTSAYFAKCLIVVTNYTALQCKDLCIDDAEILSGVLSSFGGDDGEGDNDDYNVI